MTRVLHETKDQRAELLTGPWLQLAASTEIHTGLARALDLAPPIQSKIERVAEVKRRRGVVFDVPLLYVGFYKVINQVFERMLRRTRQQFKRRTREPSKHTGIAPQPVGQSQQTAPGKQLAA